MARTVLLDTSVVSFQDILGSGKSYEVPPYQRDYSWKEEHWEDLWQDVIAVFREPELRHYMGSVVFQAKGEKRFSVIDGQQRLATLTMLVLAVIQRIRDVQDAAALAENEERVEILRRSFIGDKAPTSLLWSSKLRLNANNDSFWQEFIIQLRTPPRAGALNDSDKLLYEASRCFYDRLGDIDGLCGDGKRLAGFLTDAVASRMLFIQIIVEDELSAYTVFETLNARGVELTATDLLKNYLFSKIGSEHELRIIQEKWKRISLNVGPRKFPDFLRHLVNSQQEFIRTQRLFKVMRERVSDGAQVLDLLDTLEQEAGSYEALFTSTHERWRGDRAARRHVRALEIFRVRQFAPLMLAVLRRLPAQEHERVLRLCEVISFRYNVIGNRNTNELEKQYNLAAIAVHDGTVRSMQQIFQILRPVYVGDEEFRTEFEYKSIPATGIKRRIVRYILSAFEMDQRGIMPDGDDDSFTVEHILPENPGADWQAEYPGEQHASWVTRLGNYLPLEAGINREIGTAPLADKLAAYQRSAYLSTQRFHADSWTSRDIAARQSEMARRAVHIWRIDP